MELSKDNTPFALNDACFIDEYRLLGALPSRGEPNKLELALWDTSRKRPSPVRFETEFPLTNHAYLRRNRESNHELPFHGDLSEGIVCIATTRNDTDWDVAVIRVRDLIALSTGREGQIVRRAEWMGKVTNLKIPCFPSVLHSQVAYVHRGNKTSVLYIYDFSCHLKWENENNRDGILERTRPTPTTPKPIKLHHENIEDPSQYTFVVTEGGVYALPVSN